MNPDRRCTRCSAPIAPLKGSGRPATFCSPNCRIAHRAEVAHFEKRAKRLAEEIERADAGFLQWSERFRLDKGAQLDAVYDRIIDLRNGGGTPHRKA